MNYRTVSIVEECPVVDVLPGVFHHHAHMRNRVVSLLDVCTEKVGIIILIEQAQSLEWASKVKEEYSVLQHIYRKSTHEELTEDVLEKIISINPGDFYLNVKNNTDSLLSYLEKLAKPILERKTIFLIPEISRISNDFTKLISDYAKEVTELINLDYTPKFSFMSFAINQKNNDDNFFRVYDFFLKKMMINISLISQLNNMNNSELEVCFDKPGPLLLDGKTGTGKSLTAQLLSIKKDKQIVYINISSISKDLLESRMRGFVKGTFTDAKSDRSGWFEDANNNVLFLDEFQNSSLEVQTQLLDLLDPVSNKICIRRIGGNKDISLNVKVILAINEPIELLLEAKRIRSDLYHRIRSIYKFPDLKILFQDNKKFDVLLFIKKILLVYRWKSMIILKSNDNFEEEFPSGLTDDSLFPKFDFQMLDDIRAKYDWPGNFRELEIFAFDLYWKVDRDGVGLNIDIINKMLNEKNRINIDSKVHLNHDCQDVIKEKVRAIEKAFINNDFKITGAVKDLKLYKLSSHQTLVSFIRNNKDFFTEKFLTHPNVLRIFIEKKHKKML